MKTRNNKMAKNTYQQLNLKNKLSKQEEQRESWIGSVLMVVRWEGSVGEWVKRCGD